MAHQVVNELPEARVHILLPERYNSQLSTLGEAFPEQVHLWACPSQSVVTSRLGARPNARLLGLGRHPQLFLDAAAYLFGAMDIEASTGALLTHIEIPDHLGYGNSILAARAAGIAFHNAEIACRIHSSFTQLLNHEPDYYVRDSWAGAHIDMEAECFALADRVIAPLRAIAEIASNNRNFPAGKSVEINFPAVVQAPQPLQPISSEICPDFIFASRFQPFKRAELFIRGAVHFLDHGPVYTGTFRLMAYAFEPMYLAALRMMIPRRHAQQIIFEIDLSDEERQSRFNQAVVVQPSSYESLCLLSYETAAQQRPILLARDCAAFAHTKRWRDGENCLMFDADPASLAAVMRTALIWRPSTPVDTIADPVWMGGKTLRIRANTAPNSGALVIGPVSNLANVMQISILVRQLPLNWSVHLFSIGSDFQDAFQDDGIEHHIADACAPQQQFLSQILNSIIAPIVCLATPDALPRPELLGSASMLGDGQVLSAISGSDTAANIFAGRSPCLAVQDSRLAPTCLCLDRLQALRLIAKTASSRRVIAGMIMALQWDRLQLIIAPQVWIDQPVSPFDTPDDLRLHGTQLDRQAASIMQNARLGAQMTANIESLPLLCESPLILLVADSHQFVRARADCIEITARPGQSSFTLKVNTPLGGHMLRCTIVPSTNQPAGPLQLTVQTHDSAVDIVRTQRHQLPLSKHQLLLLGPIYGLAVIEFDLTNPSDLPVMFSLRRIRQLSPA